MSSLLLEQLREKDMALKSKLVSKDLSKGKKARLSKTPSKRATEDETNGTHELNELQLELEKIRQERDMLAKEVHRLTEMNAVLNARLRGYEPSAEDARNLADKLRNSLYSKVRKAMSGTCRSRVLVWTFDWCSCVNHLIYTLHAPYTPITVWKPSCGGNGARFTVEVPCTPVVFAALLGDELYSAATKGAKARNQTINVNLNSEELVSSVLGGTPYGSVRYTSLVLKLGGSSGLKLKYIKSSNELVVSGVYGKYFECTP